MAKNGLIMLALLFIIVAHSFANASVVLNFRKAVRMDLSSDNSTQNLQKPSPVPSEKDLNSTGHGKEKPNDPVVTKNNTASNKTMPLPGGKDSNSTAHVKEKPKDREGTTNNTSSAKTPPIEKKPDEGQSHEEKKKGGDAKGSELGTDGSCKGSSKSCSIPNTMVACILASDKVSKELIIMVQSLAEKTLKLNFVGNVLRAIEVPSRQTKKINILVAEVKANTIVLHAENGECVIQMGTPPGKNFFEELSSYSKQVTPIYGAYFLFLVALVIGGIWACCKLSKRRSQGGVPYQELEMGLPDSAAADVHVDSTEGWDQGWDDDWDDNNAVKTPGGHHAGSISANGLTSRSVKKDGWEVDWED